jgi:uncharacterized caspase-like protein
MEKLSPRQIFDIAYDVIDGTAEKQDAETLLALFCDCVDCQQPVPRELAVHLRDSFRRYLAGEQSIGAALGLVKKKGRPAADEDAQTLMATEVLRQRFLGTPHQDALYSVAEEFKCAESTVGEAWKKHRLDAWMVFRMERNLEESPWSEDELGRLVKIIERNQPPFAPK